MSVLEVVTLPSRQPCRSEGSSVEPLFPCGWWEVKMDPPLNKVLPARHYNTSIILGLDEALLTATEHWSSMYNQIKGAVSERYLEEVAFSASVLHVGLEPDPLPTHVQGNWSLTNLASQVFHFGGESPWARRADLDLRRILGNCDFDPNLFHKALQAAGSIEASLRMISDSSHGS